MPQPSEREPEQPDWNDLVARYSQAWERYSQQPTPANFRLLQTGEEILVRELSRPGKFDLGHVVTTSGALTAMEDAGNIPPEFLIRHKHGDWGVLDEFDKEQNELARVHGGRLLSAYDTRLAERIWVITDADRSSTTLLLPDEY
jgi:hypothetical protein